MFGLSPEADTARALELALRIDGVIGQGPVTMTPLAGGVSSDIYLVHDGPRKFVVKRARAKLNVAEEWTADVARNSTEGRYLNYVGTFCPGKVPRVFHMNPDRGYLCIEYFGEGWTTWKGAMFAGHADKEVASAIGDVLGRIHRHSARDSEARTMFATLGTFEQLRIEPYLLATARYHPHLSNWFFEEAARLRSQHEVLTHGDFSPKNLLIKGSSIVILDCEAAWFGDAAFDVAFLLTHLFMKALTLPVRSTSWQDIICAFRSSYFESRFEKTAEIDRNLEANVSRLLLLLLMARVDGKSPVEYLSADQRTHIREVVTQRLLSRNLLFDSILDQWVTAFPHSDSATPRDQK